MKIELIKRFITYSHPFILVPPQGLSNRRRPMAPRRAAKMEKEEDRYTILEVGRDVNEEDLKNAYLKQVKQWHPDKNPTNRDAANAMFTKITEAYNVLRDPIARAAYDPLFNPRGKAPVSGSYVVRPIKQTNRYEDIFGPKDKTLTPAESSAQRRKKMECPLQCSLEDLYKGAVKKRKINFNGIGDAKLLDDIISIEVKPGWKNGTKITYDQPNGIPDFSFIVQEMPHDVFCRKGHDLIITQEVTLIEALNGFTANVTTLDGRNLSIPIKQVIHPRYEEVVEGEGMPVTKEPTEKGNLRIRFDIKFPTDLSEEQKSDLTKILG